MRTKSASSRKGERERKTLVDLMSITHRTVCAYIACKKLIDTYRRRPMTTFHIELLETIHTQKEKLIADVYS